MLRGGARVSPACPASHRSLPSDPTGLRSDAPSHSGSGIPAQRKEPPVPGESPLRRVTPDAPAHLLLLRRRLAASGWRVGWWGLSSPPFARKEDEVCPCCLQTGGLRPGNAVGCRRARQARCPSSLPDAIPGSGAGRLPVRPRRFSTGPNTFTSTTCTDGHAVCGLNLASLLLYRHRLLNAGKYQEENVTKSLSFCTSVLSCFLRSTSVSRQVLQKGCLTTGEPPGTTPITFLPAKTLIMVFFFSLVVKPTLFLTPICSTWPPVSLEVCSRELTEHTTRCDDALQEG